MEANELRIGNYYNNNGEIEKVTPNTILEVWESERVWCKPIKLTEEWIFKLGFHNHTQEMYYAGGMQIWKCNDIFICNKNGIVIKSVHQLQNLYFALTGKELTIKQ